MCYKNKLADLRDNQQFTPIHNDIALAVHYKNIESKPINTKQSQSKKD